MWHGHESAVTIPGRVPLHGVLHGCCEVTAPAWGLVFCDPFAEEKKCAHRVMVEAARAFCAAGISCLRFDYRGTGDSPGEFLDATPEQWVQDICAALDYARETLQLEVVGLLGLRLGGALAVQAARDSGSVNLLVLWEPVINGKQYLGHNLRRSLVKAMLTRGQEFDARQVRQAHAEDVFDFDGYRVSAETRSQIEALDLEQDVTPFPGPSLVVNITSRDQPNDDCQQLARALGGSVAAVRQEPFWNRIGLVRPQALLETTEIWLAEQQAARIAGRPAD